MSEHRIKPDHKRESSLQGRLYEESVNRMKEKSVKRDPSDISTSVKIQDGSGKTKNIDVVPMNFNVEDL